MDSEVLETIKSLVGESITQENLKFIDAFVSLKLSLFMPIGGSCGYAVTPDHQHPAYMFVMEELTVTEVAQQCGFNSTSYFTKIFKEHFLETPKEFMRRFG